MGIETLVFGGWMWYAAATLVAVVCLSVVIRATFCPSDVRRWPCCGGCGFAVVAPLPERCPECGGLLTKVGISTPGMAMRLRGSTATALLAWTAMVLMVAEIACRDIDTRAKAIARTTPIVVAQARVFSMTLTQQIDGITPGAAASRHGPFAVALDLNFEEMQGTVSSGTAKFKLMSPDRTQSATCKIDLVARKYELTDAKGQESGGELLQLNEAVLGEWFTSCGVDPSVPENAVGIADTLRIMRASAVNPLAVVQGNLGGRGTLSGRLMSRGGTTSSSAPVGPVGRMTVQYWTSRTGFILGGMGCVYAAGCAFIVIKRRRALE